MNPIKTFDCADPWFDLIASGQKTIEGRINNNKYNKLKNGDIIKLTKCDNIDNYIMLSIDSVQKYNSFKEMIESETLEKLLPGVSDIEEGIKIYRKFYNPEIELEKGVIAIRIKLVNI